MPFTRDAFVALASSAVRHPDADSSYAAKMASGWRTFQRVAEHLVFNEAPKLIRQLQHSPTVQRSIKIGIDAIIGAVPNRRPRSPPAGR